MKYISIFILVLFGCNNETKEKYKDLSCIEDLGDVIANIQDHLCYLYEVYDEPCLERAHSQELVLRLTKWSLRGESEILTIQKKQNDCYILSNKSIPPQHFNALSVIVEQLGIIYQTSKKIVSNIFVDDLKEKCMAIFTQEQFHEYNDVLYILEVIDNGSIKKYYVEDRLSNEQELLIERLEISS